MQLDCISETLMVALFYTSCFLRRLGLWPDQCLNVGAYSPLGSSCIPLLKGVRGGQLFMFFNDEWMNKCKKKKKKLIPVPVDIWVQFNQKWLCFKLKVDMDQLVFKQIRCRAHLKCTLDYTGNVLCAAISFNRVSLLQ